jgi:hypothetical protein
MKNVYFLSSRRLGLACVMAGLAAVLPLQALSQAYPGQARQGAGRLHGRRRGGPDCPQRRPGHAGRPGSANGGGKQAGRRHQHCDEGADRRAARWLHADADGQLHRGQPGAVQARAVRPRKRCGAGGAGRARAGGHRGQRRVALHQRGPADPGRQGQAEHHRVRVARQRCHAAHGHGVLHARGRRSTCSTFPTRAAARPSPT